ncbi:MAG: hypothetical protein RL088_890 [Verrucomicrobiota bacterium]
MKRAALPFSCVRSCCRSAVLFCGLLASRVFAAIKPDPNAAPNPPEPDPLAELRDPARLVEVPWPEWVWWAIGVGSALVLALLVWLIVRIVKSRPKALPPTAREIAIRELNTLRGRMLSAESYPFSVEVSDVLRKYISGHYSLHATQQTSPEFLASISDSPRFSAGDRELLAKFLERCDLIKFARVEADGNENVKLLGEAVAFVEGAAK